jgi:hypothetical protein
MNEREISRTGRKNKRNGTFRKKKVYMRRRKRKIPLKTR